METKEKVSIGKVLSFNEGGYLSAIHQLKPLLPLIDDLIKKYALLGLKQFPFDNVLFSEMLLHGLANTTFRLEGQIKSDLAGKSPVIVQSSLHSIAQYLLPVEDALEKVTSAIKILVFPFNVRYFNVNNEGVVIVEEEIEKAFTQTLSSENQLMAYNQLIELRRVYNETVDVLEGLGAPVPSFPGQGLIGNAGYLNRVRISDYDSSNKIELRAETLKFIT